MKVTAEDVVKLREKTGVSILECKKALIAVGGDQEKAIEYLKENYNESRKLINVRGEWK